MLKSHFNNALSVVLLTIAILVFGDAAALVVKAQLAQVLIARSWNTTAEHPWPWADTRPVARLVIPDIKLDNFVLDGATGAVLAFGPGMTAGSAIPGGSGVTMIAAHRDTHFEALEDISEGDLIRLQNTRKQWHQYRVTGIRIADSRSEAVEPLADDSLLMLVTCYPFDALIPGGPLRYVVEAQLLPEAITDSKG